jgi:hypothetical protein
VLGARARVRSPCTYCACAYACTRVSVHAPCLCVRACAVLVRACMCRVCACMRPCVCICPRLLVHGSMQRLEMRASCRLARAASLVALCASSPEPRGLRQVDQASKLLSERRLDAAFVQCPIYEWFKPDAYNYSKSKEERARVVDVDELAVGPRNWAALGVSCAQYVDNVVRPAISSAALSGDGAADGGRPTRIYLLGPTPLPGWTRIHGTEQVESRVFGSIHNALGVRCRKHTDGTWGVSTRGGVTPIDRYAVVGGRRRDAIHPFFNGQFAIVRTTGPRPRPTFPAQTSPPLLAMRMRR